MSLTDKKRTIFTTINSYSSYMQQPAIKKSDLFSSINNKDDIVPFILDILKSIAGTEGLKDVIGSLFTKVVSSAETSIKTVLKKQVIQFNSGDAMPNDLKTNGINMPVKKIDTKTKLKIDPNTSSGQLIYRPNDFDSSAYTAIKQPNTTVSIPVMGVDLKYDDVLDNMNIKVSNNLNVGEFFQGYIDNTNILNSSEIVTNVMDCVYGTFSSENKRTNNEIIEDLKVQKLLSNSVERNEVSTTILPTELEEINRLASQLSKGVVTYNLGCGIIDVNLPFSGLTNLVNNISGSTDSFAVANAFENTISESTQSNTKAADKNKETIRDNFFQKLIKFFINVLMQAALTQPQVRVMMGIFNSIQGNYSGLTDAASDYIAKIKGVIKCMIEGLVAMIIEFLFMLAIKWLIQFLTPIITKVVKEKTNQFKNTMASLTIFNKVANVLSG